LSLCILGLSALPARGAAQESQLDVHGNWATGTSTHVKSWGGGVAHQTTFGGKSSAIAFSVAPGFDYLKQEKGGPTQMAASLDLNVQPGGSATVKPYAGASASANWSGGSAKQWDGAKRGLETMAGAQVKIGASSLSAKAEERFGYVKGQEHTLTTRIGVLITL
jgi:hypothetical protein